MPEINKERTAELIGRLQEIAAELRAITKETGVNISIVTETDKKYEDPCSYARFGCRYNLEHLYNGEDWTRYTIYHVDPSEVRWTLPPKRYTERKK